MKNLIQLNIQRGLKKGTSLFYLDSTWRLIDAYMPRVYGLFLNSFLIAEFGANLYALPGWVLGVFGLVLTFIPDPHSFILVRASGNVAQSLYSLTVPTLLFKTLISGVIVLIALSFNSSENIIVPHGEDWYLVALSALSYGGVEFLWAVLGTISLANGNVRKVAQIGILTRLFSMLILGFVWKYSDFGIDKFLFITSVPVFIGWCFLSPISKNWYRIRLFFIYGVIRYSGWMQGVALVTAGLFQLPMLVLGVWPGIDPSLVGIVAFTNRLLMAGFQPFQILQSVVIRDASRLKNKVKSLDKTSLWIVFKIGGAVFAFSSIILTGYSWNAGKIEIEALILILSMSFSVAISIFYRHELAVALAIKSLRKIFLFGYTPAIISTIILIPFLMNYFGVYGLSIAILTGWIALSNSWRWI